MRYIPANTHPDHDAIATFRRNNAHAFGEAFTQILLLAGEMNILKVGMVPVDGAKIDANASKIKSLRYDRIQSLRARLEGDIGELAAKAQRSRLTREAGDGRSLPNEIARRHTLKAKPDAAAARTGRSRAR